MAYQPPTTTTPIDLMTPTVKNTHIRGTRLADKPKIMLQRWVVFPEK
jgi:hypothetical protein